MNNKPVTGNWTPEQIDNIADRLSQTGQNAYVVASSVLGRDVDSNEGDALFVDLREIGEIAKCLECDVWKALSEMDPVVEDQCSECLDAEEED